MLYIQILVLLISLDSFFCSGFESRYNTNVLSARHKSKLTSLDTDALSRYPVGLFLELYNLLELIPDAGANAGVKWFR